MKQTKVKTKTPANKPNDFYKIMLWVSFIGALSYLPTLNYNWLNTQLGSVPDGWLGFWSISAILYAIAFILMVLRKKIGVQGIIAVSIVDAIVPYFLFNGVEGADWFNALVNLAFAGAWLMFLSQKPKFLR